MVREGRNWAVGDTVLCAERGRNWVVSDRVLCAERGENLSGGQYSVVCWERGQIERWAVQCCVLRERINWAMFVTVLCAERVENFSGGYTVLCAERREKWSVGRYNVLCWLRGELERWAIQCFVLTEGRTRAVGDTVLGAEGWENLSGGRYVVKGKYYLRWRCRHWIRRL